MRSFDGRQEKCKRMFKFKSDYMEITIPFYNLFKIVYSMTLYEVF
jgi:hypothetical protein